MDSNSSDSSNAQQTHNMVVLQPGEKVVCEIKRHPIGILITYFWGLLAIAAITVFALYFGPQITDKTAGLQDFSSAIRVGGLIVDGCVVLFVMIASYIYWRNKWIVTDDSITQVSQMSLFGSAISQIPMQNIEDVTVDRRGMLQAIFNFGTLTLQSAGEQVKFQFTYCPNPNTYARTILETHEAFIAKHSLERQVGH
jgi:hypothetical protein